MHFSEIPVRLRKLDYDGVAGASSHYQSQSESLKAEKAFGGNNKVKFCWANSGNDFPAFIWFQWRKSQPPIVKVGFSNRKHSDAFKQSPKEFSIIGSDDCKNWDTMLHVSEAGFSKSGEFKAWEIPTEQHKSYGCVGLKVFSTESAFVGITNVVMWTGQKDWPWKINGVSIL